MTGKMPIHERPEIIILHLAEGIGDPDKIAEESIRNLLLSAPSGFMLGAARPAFRRIPLNDPRYDEAIEVIALTMRAQGVTIRIIDRGRVILAHDRAVDVQREDGSSATSFTSTIRMIEALFN